MPKVSVVMAVHNGEAYIAEAVESILRQSLKDFEFLIINDESKDKSGVILAGFADERVRIIENKKQLGLSGSLNLGFDEAKGEYVARMDHDDVSLPDRLQKLADFLNQHANVDVLGTWAQTRGLRPEQTWRYPTRDEDIRSEFIFSSALVHSSVMLRKATFERLHLRYDEAIPRAQDYELWTRAASHVRFANLDTVLLQYRVHPDQVGKLHQVEQQAAADQVRLRELGHLGIKPNADEIDLHNRISRWDLPHDRAELEMLEQWFLKLRAANETSQTLPAASLDLALERRWWAACKTNISLGLEAYRIYRKAPFSTAAKRSAVESTQFWAKGLLRELGRR